MAYVLTYVKCSMTMHACSDHSLSIVNGLAYLPVYSTLQYAWRAWPGLRQYALCRGINI